MKKKKIKCIRLQICLFIHCKSNKLHESEQIGQKSTRCKRSPVCDDPYYPFFPPRKS